jgi:hypothetical protein
MIDKTRQLGQLLRRDAGDIVQRDPSKKERADDFIGVPSSGAAAKTEPAEGDTNGQ